MEAKLSHPLLGRDTINVSSFINLMHESVNSPVVNGITVKFLSEYDLADDCWMIELRMSLADARSIAHRILRAIGDRV